MIGFHETSIEQLAVEHSIEVNTFTGSARLSVPIRTSSGRESFGPSLALGYSGGQKNSAFGTGWFLIGVPSIGIDTGRNLPKYDQPIDRYAFAGGQELVPCRRKQGSQWLPVEEQRDGFRIRRYRNMVERTFERFEKWTDSVSGREHWLVYARDGVVSVFGKADDNSTRITDPSDPVNRTYQWLLEAQYDPKGNAILYLYKPEDGAGVNPLLSFESRRLRSPGAFPQRYLKRILYGNSRPMAYEKPGDPALEWRFEIVFDYGEHNIGGIPSSSDAPPSLPWTVRPDPFSTFRPGFDLRTYRLCRRVLQYHRFPELDASPCLVGATEFVHREDPGGAVLESIRFRGYRRNPADGATADRTLPPLRMTYSAVQTGSFFQNVSPTENMPTGVDQILHKWVDLENEGIPGILHRQNGSWYFKENLGEGRFGPLQSIDEVPAAVSAAFQLYDYDNDGHINLVGFEGREAGSYRRNRQSGRWEGFKALQDLPRIDLANARVQWIDLNGDGHDDLVVDHTDRLVWYPSEGQDGFSSARELAKPDVTSGTPPTLTQSWKLHTLFADMSGDGLLDMVRIDNGRVEYWPHLGGGAFSPGVLMENSPVIDGFGELDAARLRLVDLDGSGVASLLYIGKGEIRYWLNRCGNSFGPEVRLGGLPYLDNLSTVQVLDFLGDGSRCLVWSTPMPSREGQAIQFLRLTGDVPPRMLLSISNSLGRETRLSYRSSARDYIRDKRRGRPWRTRLPRHQMVIGRMESIDHIGGSRMVTRYEYRDGCFDSRERCFIGFGIVDSYDTDLLQPDEAAPPESVAPPSLTRSWYHTGEENGFIGRATEFYRRDTLAVRLPHPVLESVSNMTTEEQIDAFKTLTGSQWRQEFYAIGADGIRGAHPLRTSEYAYRILSLQPNETEHDGVYTFFQSERLSHEYEQDPTDPRIIQEVLADRGAYGDIGRRVTLSYPRRSSSPEAHPEQLRLCAELLQSSYINFDSADRYEAGIETEVRRYSLTGLSPGIDTVFNREVLLSLVSQAMANPLDFHEDPEGASPQARLIEMRRNIFWDDGLNEALPPGQAGAVTLLHHIERAVLPDSAVNSEFSGRVDGALLAGDGLYRNAEGYWWAEDSTYQYKGPSSFYRIVKETDPNGGGRTYTFDVHSLLLTAVEDAFGNRVESLPDYQVLASRRIKDANDNISEVVYDPLGVAYVTGVRGLQLDGDDGPQPVGTENLDTYSPRADGTFEDILADPSSFIQNTRGFYFYDLEAFERGDGPPFSIQLEREKYVHDGEGTAPSASKIRVTVSYIDGFGRPIQIKSRADPGPAIQRDTSGTIVEDGRGMPVLAHSADRWLTSGHDVYNNKGRLVKKYEPFFSSSFAFEPDALLHTYGVATRTHYDTAGRIIRQDLPNGTFITNTYTPWETRRSDANDNVIGSAYETARYPLPISDPEKDALTKAQAHARTPTIVEDDSLGRPYRLKELGEDGAERITTTFYGPSGLPKRVVDPRGLEAFSYSYDMLGRIIHERSMDAGDRWTLHDAEGRTVHRWDGRGIHLRYIYDRNGRLTETMANGPQYPGNVLEQIVYGDNPVVPQAKLRNARGRVVEIRDDAGVVQFDRYHMDGRDIDTTRILRDGDGSYKTIVDWSDPDAVPLANEKHRTRTRIDGLGRIEEQSLPDGTTREYDYSALGDVSEVRVTTADGRLNRQVIATNIETNARGQRTLICFGNGAETVYEYEPETFRMKRMYSNRPSGAGRDYQDIEYSYDPVGNLMRWRDRIQDPGAVSPLIRGLTVSPACEFTYDAFYQLKRATGRVHHALLEHDYRDGLPDADAVKGTRRISLNDGAAVERYVRLFDYDPSGNIQRIRHQGVTRNWTSEMWTSPSSNRSVPRKDLNGIDIPNPETWFDANGNTIHTPHLRTMEWNPFNRLSRAVLIDRSAAGAPDDAEYYVYGSDGLRVRRVTERLVAGRIEISETVYLDSCELRRISSGGNVTLSRTTSHITDGSARVASLHQWDIDRTGLETDDIAEKKIHYLLDNHLGSTALELDETGDVISYEEYFPYGGASFIAGKNKRDVKLKEYRYSGKCRDDVTGFSCYEYRYYAPFIGRWLSPDPAGPTDGPNLYIFVRNNPIRFVDADGLQTAEIDTWRALARGPAFVDESDALNYYNRTWAFERGIRITDLNPEPDKPGWWDLPAGGYRSLTESEWETIERILALKETSPEAAEMLLALEAAFGEGGEYEPDSGGDGGTGTEETTGGSEEAGDSEAQDRSGGESTTPPAPTGSGNENARPGQTDESGKGNEPTTGGGRSEGQRGKESGGGGNGSDAGPGKKDSGKGKGTVDKGGDGTDSGTDSGRSKNGGAGPGGNPKGRKGGSPYVQLPPPGVPTGLEGIPYTPDMQLPEVFPETGIPVSDPSQIQIGSVGEDDRSVPGMETGSGFRPGEGKSGKPNTAPGDERGKQDERRQQAHRESTLDTLTRWAGYLNFVFDETGEGGEAGGIPGGLGLLNISGSGFQILYIVATVISTITLVATVIKSIARGALVRFLGILRSPLATLRALGRSAVEFGGEIKKASRWLLKWIRTRPWAQFFRPNGRWRGPGSVLVQLFKETRTWAATQRWRDWSSFWFKPRWFGTSTELYEWEHFIPRSWLSSGSRYANSYLNTFIRIPAQWNNRLNNFVLPRIQYWAELANAMGGSLMRGFNLGNEFNKKIVTENTP